MPHEHVYGICENKCLVEVESKENTDAVALKVDSLDGAEVTEVTATVSGQTLTVGVNKKDGITLTKSVELPKYEPFSTYVENGVANTDVISYNAAINCIIVHKTFMITLYNPNNGGTYLIHKGQYIHSTSLNLPLGTGYTNAMGTTSKAYIIANTNSVAMIGVKQGTNEFVLCAENDPFTSNVYKMWV